MASNLEQPAFFSERVERLRAWLVRTIPCTPDTEVVRHELAEMRLRDLIHIYIGWIDKYIAPRPRQVMEWDGFWRNGKAFKHAEALNHLIDLFGKGDDPAPFLSLAALPSATLQNAGSPASLGKMERRGILIWP